MRIDNLFYAYTGIIVPLFIIIPVFISVVKYSYLSPSLKVFSWYLYLSAATNIICYSLAMKGINNMPVLHLFTVLEFTLISIYFKKVFNDKKRDFVINFLIFFLIAFSVVNVAFLQDIHTYNGYVKSIVAILIIAYAISFYKNTLDNVSTDTSSAKPTIYINTGLILYFSGSFIFFIVPNLIVPDLQFGVLIWTIHATFLLIMYILVAIGLWKHKK